MYKVFIIYKWFHFYSLKIDIINKLLIKMMRSIVIQDKQPPTKKDINKDLRWMCRSLGFVSGRDTQETSIKLFKKIIKELSQNRVVRTAELEKETGISRGAINHHIRSYINAGFLVREKNRIKMRSSSVKKTMEEIQRDADRIFENLKSIAEEIDKELGFDNR